jgi:heat shock transcription factor, other eukaryote
MLMPPAGSRKRPAPGTSPLIQHQQQSSTSLNIGALQMSTDQNLQWHQPDMTNAGASYPDSSSTFASNMYTGRAQQNALPTTASTQVARRAIDHHLVPRATYSNGVEDSWPLLPEDGLPQSQDPTWLNTTDDLEQKAQIARRDTQAKRKQIPPFVQKLSR